MSGVREMKGLRIIFSILLIVGLLPTTIFALEVAYTDKAITADPLSGVWMDATPATFNLGPQQITAPKGGQDVSIEVRGIHNGEYIGFLVEWDDATKDTTVTHDGFRDGAALQFPLTPELLPSPFMGTPEIVNIWFWHGDWQADLEGDDYLDIEYPKYGGYYFPQDEELYLKEVSGGNVILASPVEDLVAKGFGTLETQEHQDVAGKGVYSNGRWGVAFVRPLVTADEFDAQFAPGTPSSINVAVWDGSNSDRGSQKSVSLIWTELDISQTLGVGVSPVKAVVESGTIGRLPFGALALIVLTGLVGVVLGALAIFVFRLPRTRRG
jgi:hypothetical protein